MRWEQGSFLLRRPAGLCSCHEAARWGCALSAFRNLEALGGGLELFGYGKGVPFALGEIAFFVAGLEDFAVLNDYADPAGKAQGTQQTFHGGGQDLGRAHLAASVVLSSKSRTLSGRNNFFTITERCEKKVPKSDRGRAHLCRRAGTWGSCGLVREILCLENCKELQLSVGRAFSRQITTARWSGGRGRPYLHRTNAAVTVATLE